MQNIVPPSPIRTLSIFPTDICFWEALHKTDLFIIGWHELTTQGQGLGVPSPESCWSWWMTDLEDELQEGKSTRANGMFQILRCESRIQVNSGHLQFKKVHGIEAMLKTPHSRHLPIELQTQQNSLKFLSSTRTQRFRCMYVSMRYHRSGFLQQDLNYIRKSLAFRDTCASWPPVHRVNFP